MSIIDNIKEECKSLGIDIKLTSSTFLIDISFDSNENRNLFLMTTNTLNNNLLLSDKTYDRHLRVRSTLGFGICTHGRSSRY
jgi:hypothetical protein